MRRAAARSRVVDDAVGSHCGDDPPSNFLLGQMAFAIFRKTRHSLNTLPEVMHVPMDLHDQLSEFSYGYGVTREVERQLASVGLRPTPFLPSLLHEACSALT
jgi:hypothetical protein